MRAQAAVAQPRAANPSRQLAYEHFVDIDAAPDQVAAIEESCEIVAIDIPTIELAGGSVRCMIAGVHLDRRPAIEPEPTAAVEAIDENPHTADGQDVATGDTAD